MKRVLVVDDRINDVRELMEEIKLRGHEVVYTSCSLDAQSAIRQRPIDCAVYDGSLPRYADPNENPSPEWGGIFLVRETRRFFPNMPVAVYTHGLEGKPLADLTERKVPIFIKGEDTIDAILKSIGL